MAVTLIPVSMTKNSYTGVNTAITSTDVANSLRVFGATGEAGSTGMEVYSLSSTVDCSGEKIGFFVNYAATGSGTISFTVSAGGYWQSGVGSLTVTLTTAKTAAVIGPFESARFKSTSANQLVITPAVSSSGAFGAGTVQLIAFKMP